jgi:hypothetical protein
VLAACCGIASGALLASTKNVNPLWGALVGLVLSPAIFHFAGFICSITMGVIMGAGNPGSVQTRSDAELGRGVRLFVRIFLGAVAASAIFKFIAAG